MAHNHKYVQLRFTSGRIMAINTKIIFLQRIWHRLYSRNKGDEETNVISFRPLDFDEYISKKTPFV